jgi:hypothetical protein
MKRRTVTGAIIAAILLVAVGLYCCRDVLFVAIFFRELRGQMTAGQKYMDSLTANDIRIWTNRTTVFLENYNPKADTIGTYGLGAKPIPAELQTLKILRIDVYDSNEVRYVWAGGMDHTELEVHRMNDGSFKFVAHYDDEKSRVIWPKE